jgi:hypothetical protein
VPNISPDPADGIGSWSEADFVSALWNGTSPAGHHLYPALPYTSYRHMELADVRDLFAYLKTLPPVPAGRAGTIWHFPSTSAAWSASGSSSSFMAAPSCPTRRSRRNGIAALIW